MTSITWAGPRCVQEPAAILAPHNLTQGRCVCHIYITCTKSNKCEDYKINNKINLTDFLLTLLFQVGQLLYFVYITIPDFNSLEKIECEKANLLDFGTML